MEDGLDSRTPAGGSEARHGGDGPTNPAAGVEDGRKLVRHVR